jgi:hypothetical protein
MKRLTTKVIAGMTQSEREEVPLFLAKSGGFSQEIRAKTAGNNFSFVH